MATKMQTVKRVSKNKTVKRSTNMAGGFLWWKKKSEYPKPLEITDRFMKDCGLLSNTKQLNDKNYNKLLKDIRKTLIPISEHIIKVASELNKSNKISAELDIGTRKTYLLNYLNSRFSTSKILCSDMNKYNMELISILGKLHNKTGKLQIPRNAGKDSVVPVSLTITDIFAQFIKTPQFGILKPILMEFAAYYSLIAKQCQNEFKLELQNYIEGRGEISNFGPGSGHSRQLDECKPPAIMPTAQINSTRAIIRNSTSTGNSSRANISIANTKQDKGLPI